MEGKKVRIKYLLSEEGRKKSLLAGGDGKEKQEVEVDLTPEALDVAGVDYDGNAVIDLTKPLCHEITILSYGKPNFYEKKTNCYFDAPQTGEQLVRFEKNRRAKITAQKEALQPELEKALAEHEAKEAQRKAEEEEKRIREEKIKAERERLKKEKEIWIETHGSDYLQRAVKLGYNCQRQYVTERAAKEFPGYALDFDCYANWDERSCPSEAALDEVERLIQQGYDAKVVWLTEPAYEIDEDDYYAEGSFRPCEAVIVKNYLGKYVLVREF